jgi:hypothetical protein
MYALRTTLDFSFAVSLRTAGSECFATFDEPDLAILTTIQLQTYWKLVCYLMYSSEVSVRASHLHRELQ